MTLNANSFMWPARELVKGLLALACPPLSNSLRI
jgi:hypothetical protein